LLTNKCLWPTDFKLGYGPGYDLKLPIQNLEQTLYLTMPVTTAKSSALTTTRSLDSFSIFQAKEFVAGFEDLVTLQPLNKAKVRGWFVKKLDLNSCGWTATEDDFLKNSVIWNFQQTFGMPPNTKVEEGINLIEPNIQILLRSPLLIQELSQESRGQIIGTFEDENQLAKAKFDEDKIKAEEMAAKGEPYKRKFGVRTLYLVNILTKDNRAAHKIPMVLTIKGLNGTDLSEKLKMFEKEMSKCMNKALEIEVPMVFNQKFYGTCIFRPILANEMRGSNNVEICAIESFEVPDYSSKEAALKSLDCLCIPDEDRELAWTNQKRYFNYINRYSDQVASKLNGRYGIKEGVQILPQGSIDVEVLPPGNNITGEDASLL